MKYSVTHACGHAAGVTLYGPGKERDRTLAWLASRPCRDCLTDTTHERALIQQDRRELPPLVGSDKQIAWAVRCRYHALNLLDRVLAGCVAKPARIPVPGKLPGEDDPALGVLIDRLYREDRARFWIDHGQHAERANDLRAVERIGVDTTPGRQVALLLLAAAGIDRPDERAVHRVWGWLAQRPDAAAIHAATPDAHVERAMATIDRALAGRIRPYVAISGGKDSAVVAHLVERVRPDVTLFWSDDELEYPESVALMEHTGAEVGHRLVIARGWAQHGGWFTPWSDRPFWRDPLPGTLTAGMDADDWMALRGHDLTFLGTRAEESQVRAAWLETAGPLYPVKRGTGLRCCPIWDWPADYVYLYAENEGVALNPVYRRLQEIGVPLELRRVGPLPLARRDDLVNGWPDLYQRLVMRYGDRWRD